MPDFTHICLLSEHPVPNVCPLLDSTIRASEAMFVVSEQQRARLEWLRMVLHDRRVKVSKLPIVDAYGDAGGIQALVEQEIARQRERGAEV